MPFAVTFRQHCLTGVDAAASGVGIGVGGVHGLALGRHALGVARSLVGIDRAARQVQIAGHVDPTAFAARLLVAVFRWADRVGFVLGDGQTGERCVPADMNPAALRVGGAVVVGLNVQDVARDGAVGQGGS